jgi:hypothetical protein
MPVLLQSLARRLSVHMGPTAYRPPRDELNASAPPSVPPCSHRCVVQTVSPTLTTACWEWSLVVRRRIHAFSTPGIAVSTGLSHETIYWVRVLKQSDSKLILVEVNWFSYSKMCAPHNRFSIVLQLHNIRRPWTDIPRMVGMTTIEASTLHQLLYSPPAASGIGKPAQNGQC